MKIFLWIFIILSSVLVASPAFAHEQWLLTPGDIISLNRLPLPEIFVRIGWLNITLLVLSVAFLFAWVIVGNRISNSQWALQCQNYLISYSKYAPLCVRLGVASMLLISAFGVIPREGVTPFTSPTLFAPDLELKLLSPLWLNLKWVEVCIAVGLLSGIYQRLFAAGLLLLVLLSLYLFGYAMLAYAGFYIAVAIYVIMHGGGAFSLSPLPSLQVRERAQLQLRILAGMSFLYAGITYKWWQPNLALGILNFRDVFTFGINHATFVFLMAITETIFGLLIITGVLIRPLVVILFLLFILLACLMRENLFAHNFIYGILFALLINSGGSFYVQKGKIELQGVQ